MKQTFVRTLAAMAVAAVAGQAQADTLKVNSQYLGVAYDINFVVTIPLLANPALGASPFLVTNLTNLTSFEALCLEPLQPLSVGALSVGDGSYDGGTAFNFATINLLYDRYYAGALATPIQAAAFQLAIWELAADTGANVTSGPNFAVAPNGVTTLAQQMLDGTAPQTPGLYTLVRWSSFGSQDLIQAVPVPEPGTYALMFAGLLGVAAAARKRRA